MFPALHASQDFGLALEEIGVTEHALGGGREIAAFLGGDGDRRERGGGRNGGPDRSRWRWMRR